jgi:glycosyltransferase involved in cell wall biosynthesis
MPQPPLDLLCIEPRFPGRLGGVADWLVRRRGYRVRFFCHRADPPELWPEATGRGIEVVAFEVGGVAKEPTVEWPKVLERGLCYSYGGWEVLEARRPRPVDVILGRSAGLGSTLFAPVNYPLAPVVQFFDSYFDPSRSEHDAGQPEAFGHWRRAANAIELVELENGVTPWTPTEYQRGLFPPEYRDDFLVLHDGVETRGLPARNRGRLVLGDRTIPEGATVVTFVARSLDHVRGLDRFATLVGRLQGEFPDLIAIAAGRPVVDRTLDHAHFGRDYPALVLADHPGIARERFWLPGMLAPGDLRRLLARSDLHVVAGRPHPASRSLVEAMAAGCAVVAFDAEAVREFVEDGVSGRVVPDDGSAYDSASILLRDRDAALVLGEAAGERVRGRYARDVMLPALAEALDQLVFGGG